MADILQGKYPAKAHARRVAANIRERVKADSGVLYLEGRMTKLQEDNDSPEHFRQRRYFNYLTGCQLADCHFAYDIASDRSTLFIPPIDPDDVIWSGLPLSLDDALKKYDVDDVKFTTEVNAVLARLGSQGAKTVFAIAGQVSDSVTFLEFKEKDLKVLKEAVEECRVVKDEYEVALIRKANEVSKGAHRGVMERVKGAKNESELEGEFIGRCIAKGGKEQSYHGIFAAGRAAATLHYVANDALLEGKQNVLLDAGAEWECYASDITRTFPISGKFTTESRAIYDIALRMQHESMKLIKAGVLWDDVHLRAHEVAVEGLLALGILKGDKEEVLKARTSVAFFPHGLGHYLGMDTHDVGGHPNPKDDDILFRYLRLRRRVPAGSVVTVEPGVYFCEFIIEPYLKDPVHSKFIDQAVLDKYWDVGGVRIEDNLLVTETGYENLTDVPKDPEEVERIVSGQ